LNKHDGAMHQSEPVMIAG